MSKPDAAIGDSLFGDREKILHTDMSRYNQFEQQVSMSRECYTKQAESVSKGSSDDIAALSGCLTNEPDKSLKKYAHIQCEGRERYHTR